MILWGPPGTGKTTLAEVVARSTGAHFERLSAVSAGVADLRRVVAEAQARRARRQTHRALHRRDPSLQQSAARRDSAVRRGRHGHADRRDDREPVVRSELRAALALARLRAARHFRRRGRNDRRSRAHRRAARPRRNATIELDDDARATLDRTCANGDARTALNALEFAASSAPQRDGVNASIDRALASRRCRSAARRTTKAAKRTTTSSARSSSRFAASDPDAAIYWLARMIDGGEDPLFIARRL